MKFLGLPSDVLTQIFRNWLPQTKLPDLDIAFCNSEIRDDFHQQLSIASHTYLQKNNTEKYFDIAQLYLESGLKSDCFKWMFLRNIRANSIHYTGRLTKINDAHNESLQYLSEFDLSKVNSLLVCGKKEFYSSDGDNDGDFVVDDDEDLYENFYALDREIDYSRYVWNQTNEDEIIFLIISCHFLTEIEFFDSMLNVNVVHNAAEMFRNLTLLHFTFDSETDLESLCGILVEKCHLLSTFCMSPCVSIRGFSMWKDIPSVFDLICINPNLTKLCVGNIVISDEALRHFSSRKFRTLDIECLFATDSIEIFHGWSSLVVLDCNLHVECYRNGENHRYYAGTVWFNNITHDLEICYQEFNVHANLLYDNPQDINRFLQDIQVSLRILKLENMTINKALISCIGAFHSSLVELSLLNIRIVYPIIEPVFYPNFVNENGHDIAEQDFAVAILNLFVSQCMSLNVLQVVVGKKCDNENETEIEFDYPEGDEESEVYNTQYEENFKTYLLKVENNFTGFNDDCLIRQEDGRLVKVSLADSEMQFFWGKDHTRRVLRVKLSKSLLCCGLQDSVLKKTLFF